MPRTALVLTCVALIEAATCSGCSRSHRDATGAWPDHAARLTVLPLHGPDGFQVRKIYIDAGHGAPGNTGNVSSWCVDEQDFTLAAARHLASSLRATGHFETRVSRDREPVPYADRVREAEAWGADAFLSLHSDVRGVARSWSPRAGLSCQRSDVEPGFAVLFSDEASDAVVAGRRKLALLVASRMSASGFVPYDGAEYTRAYAPDGERPGVFVDRHPAAKRIYVLREPTMPSVLIETHNALHSAEAARFAEPATLDAFDAAVASALVDLFSGAEALFCGSEPDRRQSGNLPSR